MRRKRLKSQGTTTNLQEQQEGNVDKAKSSIREKTKSRTLSSPLERKTSSFERWEKERRR